MEGHGLVCTVSWLHTRDGYQLLCNRDERHTRKPALAPFVQERQGVRFISPVDGDHGGSWIAVNEFGLTFCLLNRYACGNGSDTTQIMKPEYRSRGLLLMDVVGCRSLAEVRTRINRFELEEFQPLTLVVLVPDRPSVLFHWTGCDAVLEDNGEHAMPLTSSSFDPRGVEACRRGLFEELVAERGHIDIQLLLDFHRSHLPASSAYSPCMHREAAGTVSFSWIKVTRNVIQFSYLPSAPCSYENDGNPSPDRQGGVFPADCFNRSLTVAARYRIFMPCGAARGGMGNSLLKIPPIKGGTRCRRWGVSLSQLPQAHPTETSLSRSLARSLSPFSKGEYFHSKHFAAKAV